MEAINEITFARSVSFREYKEVHGGTVDSYNRLRAQGTGCAASRNQLNEYIMKIKQATNGDVHVPAGKSGKSLKTAKVVKTKGTKAPAKKTAKAKAGARKILTVQEVNEIRTELGKKNPMTFAQIKEKWKLNSMTPIAHIKKNKMGETKAKGIATAKDLIA